MAAGRKLKVKYVDGPFDGQKIALREPFEPVLPYGSVRYQLHDRRENKRVGRFEYHYVRSLEDDLNALSPAERYARLRGCVLHGPGRRLGF